MFFLISLRLFLSYRGLFAYDASISMLNLKSLAFINEDMIDSASRHTHLDLGWENQNKDSTDSLYKDLYSLTGRIK